MHSLSSKDDQPWPVELPQSRSAAAVTQLLNRILPQSLASPQICYALHFVPPVNTCELIIAHLD